MWVLYILFSCHQDLPYSNFGMFSWSKLQQPATVSGGINSSLLAPGNVISALGDPSRAKNTRNQWSHPHAISWFEAHSASTKLSWRQCTYPHDCLCCSIWMESRRNRERAQICQSHWIHMHVHTMIYNYRSWPFCQPWDNMHNCEWLVIWELLATSYPCEMSTHNRWSVKKQVVWVRVWVIRE